MVILLTLGKSKLTLLIYFYSFGQVTIFVLSLGKTLGRKKQSKPYLFDKKFENHAQDLAKVIFKDSVRGNQEVGSPVDKCMLFHKQCFFSVQPQCCLTFQWIEPQVFLRCCLLHADILPGYFLYLVHLCLALSLGQLMSYLFEYFFIIIFIFIMINQLISLKQTHLFLCTFFRIFFIIFSQ